MSFSSPLEESHYRFELGTDEYDLQVIPKQSAKAYEIHVTKVGGSGQDAKAAEMQRLFQQAMSSQKFDEANIKLAFNALKGIKNIRPVPSPLTAPAAGSKAQSFHQPTGSAGAAAAVKVAPAASPLDPRFADIEADLKALGPKLSAVQRERAALTIKDFQTAQQNLPALLALKTDVERQDLINLKCAEYGSGGLESTVTGKDIKHRLDLLFETYTVAKSRGPAELLSFFACFATGDACLQNRTNNLALFSASLYQINVRSMPDPDKYFFLPANIFENALHPLIDNGTLDKSGSLSENRKIFKEHVLSHLEEIAKSFQENEEGPHAKAFLEYLVLEGIYNNKSPLDWAALLKAALDSPSFTQIFNYTWEAAKDSF